MRCWFNCLHLPPVLISFLLVPQLFKSLWQSDAIWQHRCRPVLFQVMACWLSAPSNYLDQCSLITNWFVRSLFQVEFIWNSNIFSHENAFEIVVCKKSFRSPVEKDTRLGSLSLVAHCDISVWVMLLRLYFVSWWCDDNHKKKQICSNTCSSFKLFCIHIVL